jgi:hypothetical protein
VLILEVHMGQGGARIQLLTRHVLHYLDEWGDHQGLVVTVGLRAKESRFAFDVQNALNHVGLILIDETCALLPQSVHVCAFLLNKLEVLSRGYNT